MAAAAVEEVELAALVLEEGVVLDFLLLILMAVAVAADQDIQLVEAVEAVEAVDPLMVAVVVAEVLIMRVAVAVLMVALVDLQTPHSLEIDQVVVAVLQQLHQITT